MFLSDTNIPPVEIKDFQKRAQRRLPRMFYQYVDSGSYSELTYRANEADFEKILLRQFIARDVSQRNLTATILGKKASLPLAIAPTGLTGMMWPDGEIEAAKAAFQFGVPYTLSTMSICSMEDVADKAQVPFWFQLYIMRDRNVTRSLISRAKNVGCDTLFVTVDLAVCGQRHNDLRNGLSVPPKIGLNNIVDMASHLPWCLSMLKTRRHRFGNIMGHIPGVNSMKTLGSWIKDQFDPSVTWEDLKKIRDLWPGKLVLKGIMEPSDAQKAIEIGADSIVVSNHGGRQLDSVSSTIRALAPIAQEVSGKVEILLDGGIRSGQDIVKARCVGANGVLIGRAYVYALACGGGKAVTSALNILKSEMDITLALCGVADQQHLTRDNIRCLSHFA